MFPKNKLAQDKFKEYLTVLKKNNYQLKVIFTPESPDTEGKIWLKSAMHIHHPSSASGHSREEKGKWVQFIIFFVSSIEQKAKYHPFWNMLI